MSRLEKLQARPDHHKHAIALGGSLIVTLVIGVAWAFSLPIKFSSLTNQEIQQQAAVDAAVASNSTSLDQMTQGLNSGVSSTDTSSNTDSTQSSVVGPDTAVYSTDGVLISNPTADADSIYQSVVDNSNTSNQGQTASDQSNQGTDSNSNQ